jgi:hypothetical protein
VTLDDARPAAVLAHVTEPAAENARELQAQLSSKVANLALAIVDHVPAGLGMLAFAEAVTDREHTPADAVARLNDRDGGAQRGEIVGRGETGESGARDDNGYALQRSARPISHVSTLNANGGWLGLNFPTCFQ